ncbi:monovalent cation/H+ antiporter complex subunit F [Marivita sp. XM-24bin2]|uniref:monovalent cation/H+ antiporter complex subunit F n=1 Tax=unclassified Marivita TaxID=2632480 RepID=UPI0025BDF520|nr:monovalent cation/H+ antiporter complex subunit F [Marivita sp. XM-24bin2]
MTGFLELSLEIGFLCIVLSVVMAFVRLIKGPSLQDRVVALDFMTVAIVAFCGLAAIRYATSAFLDVALVLALVGFLATVALARFAERSSVRTRKEASDE